MMAAFRAVRSSAVSISATFLPEFFSTSLKGVHDNLHAGVGLGENWAGSFLNISLNTGTKALFSALSALRAVGLEATVTPVHSLPQTGYMFELKPLPPTMIPS